MQLGIMGCGRMALAMLKGLLKAQWITADQCIIMTRTAASAERVLQQCPGVRVAEHQEALLRQADIVLLGVKPHQAQPVLENMRPHLDHRQPLIVSMLAGISLQALHSGLGGCYGSYLRCMPNTPVQYNQGVCLLAAPSTLQMHHRQQADALFQALGHRRWLDDETHFAALTALSGCGPGFVFEIMRAWRLGLDAIGLGDQPDINTLLLQTVLGSLTLAQEEGCDWEALKNEVVSPGGPTDRGIQAFAHHGPEALLSMLRAATEKTTTD